MKPHRITLLVIAVGFATSVGGFLADQFPWLSLLLGLLLTLVFAALLDVAVSRRDVALRLVRELEVKNSQLDEVLSRQAETEQSLRQAQRMEAVGQLAGGIAHDFNNLLQAILSYSEFLADGLAPDSALQQDVAEVQKAAHRAAGLTRQLLVFSRHHVTEPLLIDLNTSVRNAEHLLRSTLGEDIQLECLTADDPYLVLADPGDIELLLMNLAINARDAMPCGGDISVRVDAVELDAVDAASHLPTGFFARIGVTDNGDGMTPEVAAKAFEPFFTTKETGRGAGLGLAMVYGIATRAGGSASISTVGGRGNHDHRALPALRPRLPAGRSTDGARRAREHPGGAMSSTVTFPRTGPDARILIVDDEEPIRRSLVRLLDRVGFDCATAADAAEARQLLTAEDFDLMLCDVTMPGESGFSLLAHAHDQHPELAVIMVTAIDSPGTTDPASRHGAYGCILKPFDTNVILINIVGALNRRAERISEIARDRGAEADNSAHVVEVVSLLQTLAAEDLAQSPTRADTVRRVALAAEWREPEPETALHLERVRENSTRLATLVGLPAPDAEVLGLASQLHDVGKVGIPDSIVLNPRLLTEEERLTMQGHTQDGFEMLMGSDSPLLKLGSLIALSHHERFDGNGYPNRLVGNAIPLEARIVAIADVFDALRSKRTYKRAYSLQESFEILRNRRRAQLDPELLDLFISDLEKGAWK